MTKVIFEIANPEKTAELIFDLKDSLKENALKDRGGSSCILVELPLELKSDLISKKRLNKKLKEKIKEKIKNSIKNDEKELFIFITKLKEIWNKEVSPIYFKEIEKILEEKFDKKYICYFSNLIVGAYFVKGNLKNSVSSGICKPYNKESVLLVLHTIAEEILHLIYWKKWCKIFKKKVDQDIFKYIYEGDPWCAWHISEIIPEYLLRENERFNQFEWNKLENYPFSKEIRKILDPIWQKKVDFRSFLIEAHKICNCLPKNERY